MELKWLLLIGCITVALGHSLNGETRGPGDYHAVQLFSEHGQNGVEVTLYAEACSDLGSCFGNPGFDDTASSARIFGIWLFYEGYNFGAADDAAVAWIWGDDYYYEFEELDDKVSSLRYVGDANDYFANSITLFSQENFKALEYPVFADTASLVGWDYYADSAIVTGSESWTLYEEQFYSGNSVCLNPQEGGNPGLYPTSDTVGINFVGSVRRGCFADDKNASSPGYQRQAIKFEKNSAQFSTSYKKEV